MNNYRQHYIDSQWVDSQGGERRAVISPSTEEPCSEISVGTKADVDAAVAAARRAFKTFSQTSVAERVALLGRIAEEYKKRVPDLGRSMAEEM
nr:aldehyde dehydrogenase family protein [Sphingomonadaceae bacterium]